MMRVAYIADKEKELSKQRQKKRIAKKSFKQIADEAMEERMAFDRQRAVEKNATERAEVERLTKRLNQLKKQRI